MGMGMGDCAPQATPTWTVTGSGSKGGSSGVQGEFTAQCWLWPLGRGLQSSGEHWRKGDRGFQRGHLPWEGWEVDAGVSCGGWSGVVGPRPGLFLGVPSLSTTGCPEAEVDTRALVLYWLVMCRCQGQACGSLGGWAELEPWSSGVPPWGLQPLLYWEPQAGPGGSGVQV